MVSKEILDRVFRLVCRSVYGEDRGTAFTMECNHSQFLVTARHMFSRLGFPKEGTIELLTEDGRYTPYEVDIRYPADPEVDIAVMKPKNHQHIYISQVYPNRNGCGELFFGQDVFFLGFPYEYDESLMSFPDMEAILVMASCIFEYIELIFIISEFFVGYIICCKPFAIRAG